MLINDELYDAVKRVQREYPDLFALIPLGAFVDDDVYVVLRSLAEVAQEKVDNAADDIYEEGTKHCNECAFSLADYDDVYCEECYNSMEAKNYALTGSIEFLEGKLKNE